MAISNDQIYKKLIEIEGRLKSLGEEEDQVLKKEETKLVTREDKELALLSKKVNLQFDDIIEWKQYVWDSCEFKKSVEKKNKVDFLCKKTGNACRFNDCFRNRV